MQAVSDLQAVEANKNEVQSLDWTNRPILVVQSSKAF